MPGGSYGGSGSGGLYASAHYGQDPGRSDYGIFADKRMSGFDPIIQVAMAAAQLKLTKRQLDLAEKYYKKNKKGFVHWQSVFKPLMTTFVNEQFAMPLPTNDLVFFVAKGSAEAAKSEHAWYQARLATSRYQVGLHDFIDYSFDRAAAGGLLNGTINGLRMADGYLDYYDQRRYAHRSHALNVGIGVGNDARMGLATALPMVQNAMSRLQSRVTDVGSSVKGLMDAGTSTEADYLG